jgi:predicted AAA+ superfamily ATPase
MLRVEIMFKRDLQEVIQRLASKFPVLLIIGPRQSGKTTLVRETFKNYNYVLLEYLDEREYAQSDPRGFLKKYSNEYGLIIDEVQHAPGLLSYIQGIVDEQNKPGYFVLTGSQDFSVNQAITQSLAGRVGIITLLPLSVHELKDNHLLAPTIEQAVFTGGYPRVYNQVIAPTDFYPSYIHTYVERDVRQMINIVDLDAFQKFIRLCAGRTGQVLNLTSLGNDCGVSHNTAKAWISILEASYIVFLLQPYHTNFNKRLIKSPKLYFYDSGLACSLLRIKSADELSDHYNKGGLIEGFIIADLYKQYYHGGQEPALSFWRDSTGHEIDCVIEESDRLVPIEIKAGETFSPRFFDALSYWKNDVVKDEDMQGFVVYGGNQEQTRSQGEVVSWKNVGDLLKRI